MVGNRNGDARHLSLLCYRRRMSWSATRRLAKVGLGVCSLVAEGDGFSPLFFFFSFFFPPSKFQSYVHLPPRFRRFASSVSPQCSASENKLRMFPRETTCPSGGGGGGGTGSSVPIFARTHTSLYIDPPCRRSRNLAFTHPTGSLARTFFPLPLLTHARLLLPPRLPRGLVDIAIDEESSSIARTLVNLAQHPRE